MEFFQQMWDTIVATFSGQSGVDYTLRIVASVLIVVIAHYLIKLINYILFKSLSRAKNRKRKGFLGRKKRKPMNLSVIYFINSLVRVFIYLVAFLIIVSLFGVDFTGFGAILAGAIAGISLSLQDVISSFAYGVIIIASNEFSVGDWIILTGGVQGTVKRIDLLSTILVTGDGSLVYIPNNVVGKGSITNTTSEAVRQLVINLSVPFDSDLKTARAILLEEARRDEKTMRSPEPVVVITGFGDYSTAISLRLFCANKDYWSIANALYDRIYDRFRAAGLKLGRGTAEVRLADPTALQAK